MTLPTRYAVGKDVHTLSVRTASDYFLRYSRFDAILLVFAIAHGAVLMLIPVIPVIALGVWWNSNTISHNFIHKPFFRSRSLNLLFSVYLSVLLSIPQAIWRDRHVAHHAGVTWTLRITGQITVQVMLILGLHGLLLALCPTFWLMTYMPGYLLGLGLCYVHGYYEHAQGTTSHYGKLYNLLCFNDGYHNEHHADPGVHWTRLPDRVEPGAHVNRWSPLLRWLDALTLESMERWVLHSKCLRTFVLKRHEKAFHALLPHLPTVYRVGIVGGGLFPRTALILQRLMPEAQLVIIDAKRQNLQTVKAFVGAEVQLIHDWYDPERHHGFDLVVIPLAFIGDRAAMYRCAAAPALLVHDWLWCKRGLSAVVSVLLLKRLNFVEPGPACETGVSPNA
jgi:hypothetical protein